MFGFQDVDSRMWTPSIGLDSWKSFLGIWIPVSGLCVWIPACGCEFPDLDSCVKIPEPGTVWLDCWAWGPEPGMV